MDGRRIDAVTDESLDREIASLLAVEPSPEFLARVRTRVADATPHGSWVGWQLNVAAGLALATIVATAIWLSNEWASPVTQQARSTVVEPVVEPVPRPRSGEPEGVPSAPVVESALPRITRPTRRATDVVAGERVRPVVNEEDGEAFDAFLATIRSREVVLTFNESPDSALAASPLVIAPIAIDPLPDVLEGGVE
jgi:hypothetical protein